jgi:hypothetical protein
MVSFPSVLTMYISFQRAYNWKKEILKICFSSKPCHKNTHRTNFTGIHSTILSSFSFSFIILLKYVVGSRKLLPTQVGISTTSFIVVPAKRIYSVFFPPNFFPTGNVLLENFAQARSLAHRGGRINSAWRFTFWSVRLNWIFLFEYQISGLFTGEIGLLQWRSGMLYVVVTKTFDNFSLIYCLKIAETTSR